MRQYIDKIRENKNLTFNESKAAFEILMEGKANDEEIYDFCCRCYCSYYSFNS